MNILEKLSGALYPVVVAGVICGFLWQILDWLQLNSAPINTVIPPDIATARAIAVVVLLAWLLERLFPLRALAELRWVYHERPRKRMCSIDSHTGVQLAIFALIGATLGAGLGHLFLGAAGAILVRVAFGLQGAGTLPALLQVGRTRMICAAPLLIQDNEMSSEALAAQWAGWPKFQMPNLVLQRLLRRSYLLCIALCQLLVVLATSNSVGWALLPLFTCSWTVIGAGIYRCADVRRLNRNRRAEIITVVIHGLVGDVLCLLLWQISLVEAALLASAIAYGSFLRGQPRRVFSLTYSDNAFGMSVPPELVTFYGSGWWGVAIAAGIVFWW